MRINELQRAVVDALARNDRESARTLLGRIIDSPQASINDKAQARLALGMTYLRKGDEESLRLARNELVEGIRLSVSASQENQIIKGLIYLLETVRTDENAMDIINLVEEIKDNLSPHGRENAKQIAHASKVIAQVWKEIRGSIIPILTQKDIETLVDSGFISDGFKHLLDASEFEQKGKLLEALDCAEKGRQYALDTVDPFLYLLSCATIARLRDQRNEKVQALTILFTCKASLEDLLGPSAGQHVVLLIDALEKRWGKDEFARTLNEYRKQFA